MSAILRTFPTVGLFALLAGVSWHGVTLAIETAEGLVQAL